MITPHIAMVAYDDRNPHFIFVAVPNQRGRYLRTDKSVAFVSCPMCGATVGEPCFSRYREAHGQGKVYGGTTHYHRRVNAKIPHRGEKPDDIIGEWKDDPIPDECMEPAA